MFCFSFQVTLSLHFRVRYSSTKFVEPTNGNYTDIKQIKILSLHTETDISNSVIRYLCTVYSQLRVLPIPYDQTATTDNILHIKFKLEVWQLHETGNLTPGIIFRLIWTKGVNFVDCFGGSVSPFRLISQFRIRNVALWLDQKYALWANGAVWALLDQKWGAKRWRATGTVYGLFCWFLVCFWVRNRLLWLDKNKMSKRSGRQLQFLGGFASSLYALGSEIECSDSMKNEVSKRSGATVAVCGLFWGFLICVWVRNRAF